jgi:hypothetical protein
MNRVPFITQILKIEPFKITCLWNIVEVRVNDFEEEFVIPKRIEVFID